MILRDLAREPGSLPLLSHALLETWQRRIGTTLTLAGYHDSGGVRGAIARTAETAWTESLTEQQRPIARRIFLRLTELGEGTEDTRRRVARTELVSGADADAVDEVLRDLADRRLITVDDDTVEVAHEALIREWPRLRGWLDDDREGLRTHRHLTHAAEDWNALGRDASELYRGPRLQATRDWLERDPSAQLNELETAFFDASAEQERTERAEEHERIAARERANRRLRILLVAAAIALVIAIGTGAVAIGQRGRANRQADRARAVSVSAEVDRAVAEVPILLERDRSLALLLAVQAQRIRPDAATNSALFAALVDEPRLRSTAWGGHEGYAWMKPLRPNQVVALGRQGADVWDLTRARNRRFLRRTSGSGGPGDQSRRCTHRSRKPYGHRWLLGCLDAAGRRLSHRRGRAGDRRCVHARWPTRRSRGRGGREPRRDHAGDDDVPLGRRHAATVVDCARRARSFGQCVGGESRRAAARGR